MLQGGHHWAGGSNKVMAKWVSVLWGTMPVWVSADSALAFHDRHSVKRALAERMGWAIPGREHFMLILNRMGVLDSQGGRTHYHLAPTSERRLRRGHWWVNPAVDDFEAWNVYLRGAVW